MTSRGDYTELDIKGSITSVVDNIVTINATKAGSFAMSGTEKYFFTDTALQNCAETWIDGIVTLNHMYQDDGKILNAWYEEPYVKMSVSVDNSETLARINESTGVSIEAKCIIDNENNITDFKGTGISFIFYPDQPCCSKEEGCGVITASINGGNCMEDTKVETVSKVEFDDLQAKYVDVTAKIAEYEAGETIKGFETTIADLEAKISTLENEIETRYAVVVASLVQEIQALDDSFEQGDMNLDTLKAVHASITKIAAKQAEKIKAVDEEPVEVSASCNFTAPVEKKSQAKTMRIGGWKSINGKMEWIND